MLREPIRRALLTGLSYTITIRDSIKHLQGPRRAVIFNDYLIFNTILLPKYWPSLLVNVCFNVLLAEN